MFMVKLLYSLLLLTKIIAAVKVLYKTMVSYLCQRQFLILSLLAWSEVNNQPYPVAIWL